MTSTLVLLLRLTLIVGAILLTAFPAWGQRPIPPLPSPWSVEFTPYLWAGGMHGDLSMLATELRYDRWGLLFDAQYIKMSEDGETAGPAFSDLDVESKTVVLAPAVAYRAVWLDRFTLDALAGVRVWIVDTELEFKPGLLPGMKVDQEKSWADPIVGLRAGLPLTKTVSLTALGDVGGFGAGSDLTWQGLVTFNYLFSPRWTLRAGYRALGVDSRRAASSST